MITSLYILPLTIILLVLIFQVIKLRRKNRVGLGSGGHDDLTQAIRAHGNFVETVPFALILMVLLEYQGAPDWAIHIFGGLLVIARIAHAQGLYESKGESKGRLIGTLTTLFLFGAGAVALFGIALIDFI